jgi:hypothetical protein
VSEGGTGPSTLDGGGGMRLLGRKAKGLGGVLYMWWRRVD